ncbi:MAG: RNA polymerase sigma factor RpoD/SigA [Bacteroidota bacterium]
MRALKITNSITRRDEKSLEKYLSEISRFEVLTPEEEVNLFRRLKGGESEVLDQIVAHNLRFVVTVAKQYQNMGLWLGDLVNEGNIGLIKAAQRFDETRGFKFISYAVWWIRQSIIQAVNEKSNKVRLPLNLRGTMSKVMKSRNAFLQREEREPTVQELMEVSGFSERNVRSSLKYYKKSLSLDAPISEGEDYSMLNMMSDDKLPAPDYKVQVEESQKIEIKNLLNNLPPRQAEIVAMYYGIGRRHPLSLDDIGDRFGITRERTRQLRDRAIRKLRMKLDRQQRVVAY